MEWSVQEIDRAMDRDYFNIWAQPDPETRNVFEQLLEEGWQLHGFMHVRTEEREMQLTYKSYIETIYTQAMVK